MHRRAIRFVLLSGVLIVWMGWGLEEALFALAAAGLAEVVHARISGIAAGPISLRGLARFIPFMVNLSIRGGVDVALRALSPSMPLAPGFYTYQLRVDPQGTAAIFFSAAISLIPGTLYVDRRGDAGVMVHVVDIRSEFEAELCELEERVAQVFFESLKPSPGSDEGRHR